MIYKFIFDYLICLFTPFSSCLILFDIDKAKLYEVFIIALVLDILFGKFILLLYLIILWFFIRKINFKKFFVKNILIFIIYNLFLLIINGFSIFIFVSNFIFMMFYFLFLKHII